MVIFHSYVSLPEDIMGGCAEIAYFSEPSRFAWSFCCMVVLRKHHILLWACLSRTAPKIAWTSPKHIRSYKYISLYHECHGQTLDKNTQSMGGIVIAPKRWPAGGMTKGWPHRRWATARIAKMRRLNRSWALWVTFERPRILAFQQCSGGHMLEFISSRDQMCRRQLDGFDVGPSLDKDRSLGRSGARVEVASEAQWFWPFQCAKINNKHKDMYNIWKTWITKVRNTWYNDAKWQIWSTDEYGWFIIDSSV
jgi:hypothetical protein